MSNTATLTPELRALILRRLGEALAAAWRRQHGGDGVDRDDGGSRDSEEGGAGNRANGPAPVGEPVRPKEGFPGCAYVRNVTRKQSGA